jgi:hypothetical protein
MKAQGGISYDNAAVAVVLNICSSSLSISVTTITHRSIMRSGGSSASEHFFLREYAAKFISRAAQHGISFERIPRIEEMNDILAKIDWVQLPWTGSFRRRRSWNFKLTKCW